MNEKRVALTGSSPFYDDPWPVNIHKKVYVN
jgi:hypothetical protein